MTVAKLLGEVPRSGGDTPGASLRSLCLATVGIRRWKWAGVQGQSPGRALAGAKSLLLIFVLVILAAAGERSGPDCSPRTSNATFGETQSLLTLAGQCSLIPKNREQYFIHQLSFFLWLSFYEDKYSLLLSNQL